MGTGTIVSESEFGGAQFGDERLSRRLEKIAGAMEIRPEASFPAAMTPSELEAVYRFMSNDRVEPERILAPHRRATVQRCTPGGTVLSVEDTTTFQFQSPRDGLGEYGGRTFFAHVSLCVDLNGAPLGVLGLETWARTKDTPSARRQRGELSPTEAGQLPNEQDRWISLAERVEEEVGGRSSVIHVMDSEADDYDLMQQLVRRGRRFVIRSATDRRLEPVDGSPAKMQEVVSSCPVRCVRTVKLSKRPKRRLKGTGTRKRNTPREGRDATLSIGSASIRVRAPSRQTGAPEALDLNIVCVREDHPPQDVEPVEWVLITTEPIETVEQVLEVVDIYRQRWKIEELFKALKTGCSFEKRQLESYRGLVNALALLLPIAWNLLRLRTLCREGAKLPASAVLSEPEIVVLRGSVNERLPKKLTLEQAMTAVARLGGHLKRNGPPGWLVLGRGYLKLLDRVEGYLLAQRCDQS